MLMGEHAVLHKKTALVAALSPRLSVQLTPRHDASISIASSLGCYESKLQNLRIEPPFQFILSLIQSFQPSPLLGFHLKIESDFSSTLGLGSSAAILVATSSVLLQFYADSIKSPIMDPTDEKPTPFQPKKIHPLAELNLRNAPSENLTQTEHEYKIHQQAVFERAYASLLKIQGCGSGADLAAATWGGILHYQAHPFSVQPIWPHPDKAMPLPFTLLYSGYKTPTATVIQAVEAKRQQNPVFFEAIFEAIEDCTQAGSAALRECNFHEFSKQISKNQALMCQLGVSDTTLNEMVSTLNARPEISASKISGSGLGDCVIALGAALPPGTLPWTILSLQFSPQGLRLEKTPTPHTQRDLLPS